MIGNGVHNVKVKKKSTKAMFNLKKKTSSIRTELPPFELLPNMVT